MQYASVLFLIFVNLIPVIGAIFFGWDTKLILPLYWAENVIIGIFNVLKMVLAGGSSSAIRTTYKGMQIETPAAAPKFFIIPFFIVHYGIFCTVHGTFVFGLTFAGSLLDKNPTPFSLNEFLTVFLFPLLMIFLSHAFSFIVNYLGKGEYKKAHVSQLMFQPYGRIVITQFVIILGTFLMISFNQSILVFVLLILFKTVADVFSHLQEHSRLPFKYNFPMRN